MSNALPSSKDKAVARKIAAAAADAILKSDYASPKVEIRSFNTSQFEVSAGRERIGIFSKKEEAEQSANDAKKRVPKQRSKRLMAEVISELLKLLR